MANTLKQMSSSRLASTELEKSSESHSVGSVTIWYKQDEGTSILPVFQAAAGAVMVWGISSTHTEHCLNATAYSSIIANNVHPFIATVVHQCGYSQLTVSFLNMKLSPLHLHWVFPCWICAMKNLVGCEGKRGSNLILTSICLIMWPLSVEQENIWL